MQNEMTIGQLSKRTGMAVSAIRFYETHGIVTPARNHGGHRRYNRSDLRRLSFAMIAQRLGISLCSIAKHLQALPQERAPNRHDWAQIATGFRAEIATKVAALTKLGDLLDGCIGCGCLSLDRCALYNPLDIKATQGAGPRNLIHVDAES